MLTVDLMGHKRFYQLFKIIFVKIFRFFYGCNFVNPGSRKRYENFTYKLVSKTGSLTAQRGVNGSE